MGLFKQIEVPLNKVLIDLFRDEDLRETITYWRYVGQAFDQEQKFNVEDFDKNAIGAIKLRHNVRTVAMSSVSEVQVGDLFFLFRYGSLPLGMSLKDMISDNEGNKYGIRGFDPVFKIATFVTVGSPE